MRQHVFIHKHVFIHNNPLPIIIWTPYQCAKELYGLLATFALFAVKKMKIKLPLRRQAEGVAQIHPPFGALTWQAYKCRAT